jgi:diketogulonate reductase-like aldo/keto reductase
VLLLSSSLVVNVVAASSLRASSSPSPSSVFDDIDVVLDDVVGTIVSNDDGVDDHPDDVTIVEQPSTTTTSVRQSSADIQSSSPIAVVSSQIPRTKKKSLTIKLSTHYHHSQQQSSTTTSSPHRMKDSVSEIPLVGIGVGNLPHNKIPYVLAVALDAVSRQQQQQQQSGKSSSITSELNYRLIDTSRQAESALEVLVGRSLSRISSSSSISNDNDTIYHVMIKIWHTHLGYDRTMLSVRDSLSNLLPTKTDVGVVGSSGHPDVRIHAILQHPRCYDELFATPTYLNSPNLSTKYSNCSEEEDGLEDSIKQIDNTSPLADKDGAWKRSYRALEELYHQGVIESIGIGDFGPSDLDELLDLATVGPHIYQGTLHTLLTQERLIEELVKHGVHYQCYDVVSTVLKGKESAPVAYSKLVRIGAKHGGLMEEEGDGYSPIQVVLGYLVHHRGVGVIPGTTNDGHLAENSPSSLGNMQRFGPREVLDIETSLLALVNGKDDTTSDDADTLGKTIGEERFVTANGSVMEDVDDTTKEEGGVVVTFFNTLPHPRSVRIFQIHPSTGEQIQLSHGIPPGRSGRMIVNIDDVLIAYDGHGVAVKKFLVEKSSGNGESVDFIIESS